MKTEKQFWAEGRRLHDLCEAKGLNGYELVNECVDLENCEPFNGQADFWDIAFHAMHNATGQRLSDLGLNPKDFDINF